MSYCRFSSKDEEWRDIVSWPYQVSSHGHVRRSTDGGSPIAKAGRQLSLKPDNHGYVVVSLCDYGRNRRVGVHVLVCEAFNGEKPDKSMQVRHLDGVRTNNHFRNLAWGTVKQNAEDKKEHGRQFIGEDCIKAKLTQEQVNDLRMAYKEAKIGRNRVKKGWMLMMAVKYNVSTHSISGICRGKGYVLLPL